MRTIRVTPTVRSDMPSVQKRVTMNYMNNSSSRKADSRRAGQEFLLLYGTRRSITLYKRACHLSTFVCSLLNDAFSVSQTI
jgi:hypothetical protein